MNASNASRSGNRKRRDLYLSLSVVLEVMLIAAVLPALQHAAPVLTQLSI
jgi:hypothetical protein